MKKTATPYDEAHLFVAAIRVLTHQKGAPPSIEDVCGLLSFSPEWGRAMGRRLKGLGIIEVTEAQFTTKLFIEDHLKLEDLPREKIESGLGAEVERFRERKKDWDREIEGIQAKAEKQKKDLFAELEKKLNKESHGS